MKTPLPYLENALDSGHRLLADWQRSLKGIQTTRDTLASSK